MIRRRGRGGREMVVMARLTPLTTTMPGDLGAAAGPPAAVIASPLLKERTADGSAAMPVARRAARPRRSPAPAAYASPAITLSVVIPVYNEEEGLPALHRRLTAVLTAIGEPYEIIYVNDGSRDRSLEMLYGLRAADPHAGIVNLSRNFGKEIAVTAGLDHARGDAVVVIDADLQDPPELIPELVAKWRQGYDAVYARRLRRDGETVLKKASAALFYRLIHKIGPTAIPQDTGDFRLMSRRVVDAVTRLRESHRFMKGLFAWVGYRQAEVPYVRDARFAGTTKWNYWKLWNLALEGITSFTVFPLKVASYAGLAVAMSAFLYGGYIVGRTILYGADVPGYPSLLVFVLFLGGLQLVALGVIGEYLGRTFNEVKGRPLYLVADYVPAADDDVSPGGF
jgi:glycosyltransferase involved in cell wall biosynthesis